jgi:hypothetical protein
VAGEPAGHHAIAADAGELLSTAEAVLKNSQEIRVNNLLQRYRNVAVNESRLKALATLFDPDQRELSDSAQKTIRGVLSELIGAVWPTWCCWPPTTVNT